MDKNVSKIYIKKHQHIRKSYINKALSGESQNFKAKIIHRNGQTLNFEITYIPIMGEKEQVLGIYGIAKDITLLTKNRQELLKVKENLELAQQVAKIGSWEYDIVKDQVYWSKQIYEIYGIDQKMFTPTYKKIVAFVHPEDRLYFDSIYETALKNRESCTMEYRIRRMDGNTIYVFVQAELILDENSRPIKYVGVIQDINKKKSCRK
ncbi:PAS domain-containing protein [Niallia hominis]|uniref:histidine kinase n=1 Tax=Niallia hominis TaxID=3133173 RepID=A0ABV1F606_9BACI